MIICYYKPHRHLEWRVFKIHDDIIKNEFYGYATPRVDKNFLFRSSGGYSVFVNEEILNILVFKKTATMNRFIDLLEKWKEKKWQELVNERSKIKKYREKTKEAEEIKKDIESLLKSDLKDTIVGISRNGIDFLNDGFIVTVLCKSSYYNKRKTFELIKANQTEFIEFVRSSVSNHSIFKKKGGTINAYQMSRFTVLNTPEIVCVFDIRKVE